MAVASLFSQLISPINRETYGKCGNAQANYNRCQNNSASSDPNPYSSIGTILCPVGGPELKTFTFARLKVVITVETLHTDPAELVTAALTSHMITARFLLDGCFTIGAWSSVFLEIPLCLLFGS